MRVSWDPTYTTTAALPDNDAIDEPLEEGEDEEGEPADQNEEDEVDDMDDQVFDQPIEIQIRNPNKINSGQVVLKAIIGPEDKFYIQHFWVGTGSNLSMDTWLNGAETSKLIFSPIEEYSTDYRHALYDYLDIIGVSDNTSRFISAHTRVNKNIKQREMMVRMLQFLDPMDSERSLKDNVDRIEKSLE